jgi:hypothetical protein
MVWSATFKFSVFSPGLLKSGVTWGVWSLHPSQLPLWKPVMCQDVSVKEFTILEVGLICGVPQGTELGEAVSLCERDLEGSRGANALSMNQASALGVVLGGPSIMQPLKAALSTSVSS